MDGSWRRKARATALGITLGGLATLAGCGDDERQDANEPSGSFPVEVVEADFATEQRLAQPEELVVRVRNAGGAEIPNVAVTVDGFDFRSEQPDLADPERPTWIVDDGPEGGATANTNTWALGSLAAGQTREFVWNVTAVRAGTHTLRYRVAAGLDGKARAVGAGGREPAGEFVVTVSDVPPVSRVDPQTGDVVRDPDS